MKKIAIIASIGLTFAAAGTLTAGLISSNNGAKETPIETKAATTNTNYGGNEYYIYYVSDKGPNQEMPNNIHAWNGSGDLDTWPGEKITNVGVDITNNCVLHFEQSYIAVQIYKITFAVEPTGFLFNYNGDESKSDNKTFTNGAAYWWTSDANVDAGLALDLLNEEEIARNSVTASGDIYANSICGIPQDKAASLFNKYNTMDPSIRQKWIDASYVYTYTDETASSSDMICCYDIFQRLGKIGKVTTSSNTINEVKNNDTTFIAIAVITSVAVVSLSAAFIMLKKRKESK